MPKYARENTVSKCTIFLARFFDIMTKFYALTGQESPNDYNACVMEFTM